MKEKVYFDIVDRLIVCKECSTQECVIFPVDSKLLQAQFDLFARNHIGCVRNLYRPLSDG
jgi:hypothetical protein